LKNILIACAGYQDGAFYGIGKGKESLKSIQEHYPRTNVKFLNDAEGMA
jgi:hypothetical protein